VEGDPVTRPSLAIVALILLPAAAGAQVGEKCQKGDPPPRAGLLCRPAFIEQNGVPAEEWEFDSAQILNARKGDALLSAGCGPIGNLLRRVDPPQDYSHSGIMSKDRYEVRHSTSADDRYADYGVGSEPGSDGIRLDVLKFGWPGTITQDILKAYEGDFIADPESGKAYLLESFNRKAEKCDDDTDLAPATVLKPPPDTEVDAATSPRPMLNAAADAALATQGHYRFFGYSQPAQAITSPAPGSAGWATGTVGTVCSALIWKAMGDAGFTLEGGVLEPHDDDREAEIDADTPDGLYLYRPEERLAAGEWLYQYTYDSVNEDAGTFGTLLTDAPDDVASQLLNCFAHDWCGPENPPAVCGDDEENAKDSSCWQEHPGKGHAVAPDDLMSWDAPPAGPYGHREDLVYQAGRYVRVYRWGPADGAGTLFGTVTAGGAGAADAIVRIEGLDAAETTGASGAYEIVGVPQGLWTVQACRDDQGAAAIFNMPLDGQLTKDLALAGSCLPNVSTSLWHRKVELNATVHIVDHENVGANEIGNFDVNEEVLVQPPTEDTPASHLGKIFETRCTGDEVRVELKVEAELNVSDRSVDVFVEARLLEGTSCSTDDLAAVFHTSFTLAPDDGAAFTIKLLNEEFDGGDSATIQVSLSNSQG
jgi:hypothetical protein